MTTVLSATRIPDARARWLVPALLAAIAAACMAMPAATPAAQPDSSQATGQKPGKPKGQKTAKGQKGRKRQVKPRPMYWGAWIGNQLTGEQPPWDMRAISIFESMVGKGLSLIALSSPFADCTGGSCDFYEFPRRAMDNARHYGAIPFFNWSSQSTSPDPNLNTHMPDFQLADVLAGSYDGYIREFAADARDWGHPFFLRFNWEMNGRWFPWAERVNGNKPGESIRVWRHVHDIFAAVGATNVTWVWCPYVDVHRNFQPLAQVYPGNGYVDWTCLDGFNWAANPTNPHPWQSFDQIFTSTYHRIVKRIAPTKPMVLAEMASTGKHRAKARWIRNMFKALATKFRRIRGLIWFNQVDRGIDWPLETSPAATRAFAEGIRNRAFRSNVFAGATARPLPPPD